MLEDQKQKKKYAVKQKRANLSVVDIRDKKLKDARYKRDAKARLNESDVKVIPPHLSPERLLPPPGPS